MSQRFPTRTEYSRPSSTIARTVCGWRPSIRAASAMFTALRSSGLTSSYRSDSRRAECVPNHSKGREQVLTFDTSRGWIRRSSECGWSPREATHGHEEEGGTARNGVLRADVDARVLLSAGRVGAPTSAGDPRRAPRQGARAHRRRGGGGPRSSPKCHRLDGAIPRGRLDVARQPPGARHRRRGRPERAAEDGGDRRRREYATAPSRTEGRGRGARGHAGGRRLPATNRRFRDRREVMARKRRSTRGSIRKRGRDSWEVSFRAGTDPAT